MSPILQDLMDCPRSYNSCYWRWCVNCTEDCTMYYSISPVNFPIKNVNISIVGLAASRQFSLTIGGAAQRGIVYCLFVLLGDQGVTLSLWKPAVHYLQVVLLQKQLIKFKGNKSDLHNVQPALDTRPAPWCGLWSPPPPPLNTVSASGEE